MEQTDNADDNNYIKRKTFSGLTIVLSLILTDVVIAEIVMDYLAGSCNFTSGLLFLLLSMSKLAFWIFTLAVLIFLVNYVISSLMQKSKKCLVVTPVLVLLFVVNVMVFLNIKPKPFMLGLEKFINKNVDVATIQDWVDTTCSKPYFQKYGDMGEVCLRVGSDYFEEDIFTPDKTQKNFVAEIKPHIDLKAIRKWLKHPDTISDWYGIHEGQKPWPDPIKKLSPGRIELWDDNDNNMYVDLFWGRGWDKAMWPEHIKDLNPGYVYVSTTDSGSTYANIEWGGSLIGRWGIIVGVSSSEIPPREDEHRKPISENAFIWYRH